MIKMNKEDIRCNHNPNDIDNSLKIIKRVEMVNPQKYYFQCEECKDFFVFVKNSQIGAFELCD